MDLYHSHLSSLKDSAKITEYLLGEFKFSSIVMETEENYHVQFISNTDSLILHWGLSISRSKEWLNPLLHPLFTALPPSTQKFDEKACQSPFQSLSQDFSLLEIIFPKPTAPLELNFVLKKSNSWYNNQGNDYKVMIKEKEIKGLGKINNEFLQSTLSSIIEAETNGGGWTLMLRFNMCNQILGKITKDHKETYAWIFVWMRYSALRKLDWQRKQNTRPVNLALSQKNLTLTLVNLLKTANAEGLVSERVILKNILSSMGKGGDNGQRIRDEILQILHKGGIRHRIKDKDSNTWRENYYEQWHQKLHNNTTPDDIGICEALIRFNETNDLNKYWEVLAKHGITRERLESFDRAITLEPFYAPQIVSDLYGYWDLLKAVHGSADLAQCIQVSAHFLPDYLTIMLMDLHKQIDHWDQIQNMQRIMETREKLNQFLRNQESDILRDGIYLDLALEAHLRQICEKIIHLDIDIVYLMKELMILLQNIKFSVDFEEFDAVIGDFLYFYEKNLGFIKSDSEVLLIFKSICDRIQRILGKCIDEYTALIDPKARFLGQSFGIESEFVEIFSEEVIRGSLFFSISIVLKKIDSELRKLGELRPWQIISPKTSAVGILLEVESLHSIAFTNYNDPVIIICKKVTGEEEIPLGVVAVLCTTELDMLAHVCVRARNNKILFAICFDRFQIENFLQYQGKWVELRVKNQEISIKESEKTEENAFEIVRKEVKSTFPTDKIGISIEEFAEGKTGAKSNNCAILKQEMPNDVPKSVALPFGALELVLSQRENIETNSRINTLTGQISNVSTPIEALPILAQLKSEVMGLTLPEAFVTDLQNLLGSLNLPVSDFNEAFQSIKKVWASKYNERVYLSTLKSQISLDSIKMAVLCQELIQGDYAFVLHTKNPVTNNTEEIYGEIVIGLGETLVSAFEGRSLSFVAHKFSGDFKIENFCNKSVYLKGNGFIFRSDSNCEDLPGFAGAGLFDSFVMQKPVEAVCRYSQCKIVTDKNLRTQIIKLLKNIGKKIEALFGGVPQDIEGVIKGSQIFVVQSRPQV